MLFLVLCPLLVRPSQVTGALLLGGVEFVSLWSGQEAPNRVAERLAALAGRPNDWPTGASPESRLTLLDWPVLLPLLLPTEHPPPAS